MKKYSLLIIALLALFACKESKELAPISGSMGTPDKITNIEVTPVSGGAEITYSVPDNEDLLYIEAKYTLSNGKEMTTRVSYFDNLIKILGYVDETPKKVTLYSINRAQVKSEGVEVEFTPLKSPLNAVAESLDIIGDFGGVTFNWLNEEKTPLVMEFLAPDSLGSYTTMRLLSTDADTATISLRGYDPEPIQVGVIISDAYGNVTDTIAPTGGKVTPLFEQVIPKDNMGPLYLDGDLDLGFFGGTEEGWLDDDITTGGHSNHVTIPNGSYGIDYGTTFKASRIILWHHSGADWSYYWWGSVKEFEMWYATETPNPNGTFEGWTKLGDYIVERPSGQGGVGVGSEEDQALAIAGHNYNIPLDVPPFRYLRFVFNKTWGNTSFVHPCGFQVYGQIIE